MPEKFQPRNDEAIKALDMVHNLGETIRRVQRFCEIHHRPDCQCLECETKRRVLRIISDNLK